VAGSARRTALFAAVLALLIAGPLIAGAADLRPAAAPRLTVSAQPAADCRLPATARTVATLAARGPSSREVPYGTDGGQPLLGILSEPGGAGSSRPAVLLVHGGGWLHGTPMELAAAARTLTDAGFVTFNIGYRLAAPGHPAFPGELQDVRQALHYLRAHADSIGIDPRRIGALGSSAGGNLVSLLATSGTGSCLQGDRIAAVVAWSPPIDVGAYGRYADAHCAKDLARCPYLVQEAVHYIGCSYQSCPTRWQQASVPGHVTADDPPTLLFNSTHELIPLSQARAFTTALSHHHVPYQLVVLHGRLHASGYQSVALPLTVSFFERYLRPAPAADARTPTHTAGQRPV
jgi:acetyl esterase/lipase